MLKRRLLALLMAGVMTATNAGSLTAYAASEEAATLVTVDETGSSAALSGVIGEEVAEETAEETETSEAELIDDDETTQELLEDDEVTSEEVDEEDADFIKGEDEAEEVEDDLTESDSEKSGSEKKAKEDKTETSKESKEQSSELMAVKTIDSVHEGEEVSRIVWLRELINTFGLTVGEDDYPDNYYADIDSDYDFYSIAMTATEYGLVDVYPGENFEPDAPATRDFAARSLNMCLGYIAEADGYSYPDSGSTSHPDDAQVAIEQGWFKLLSGNFGSDEAVLEGEFTAIFDYVKEILADDASSGTGEFEYKDDVKLLPEGTEITTPDSGVLLLVGYASNDIGLKAGDLFGIVYEDMPLAWKAESVSKSGSDLRVEVSTVDMDEAFETIDVGVTNDADVSEAMSVSDSAELFYVVGGTEENNYKDGQLFSSVEELGDQQPDALLIEDEVDLSELYASVDVADGVKLNYSVSIKNFKYDWAANRSKAHFNTDFDVQVQASLSADLLKMAGIEVPVCKIPIAPGILYEVGLSMSLKGTFTVVYVENIQAGVNWEKGRGVRFTKNFTKKSFTATTEIEGNLGVYAKIKANYLVMEAQVFAEIGLHGKFTKVIYLDDKQPHECKNIQAWLYADIGYSIEILNGLLYSKDEHFVFYDSKNSPIKICAHYENGAQVESCTRAEDFKAQAGTRPGYTGGKGQNWYSPKNTQYYYNGSSSKVADYAIFEYELSDIYEATITKYHGNMRNLVIPSELDGHKVVGIGGNVFEDNKRINYVSIPDGVKSIGIAAFNRCTNLTGILIPDSVTSIDRYAFTDCSSLDGVTLPHNLTYLGAHAFHNCTSLTQINIPKTLDGVDGWNGHQAFTNTALTKVIFDEGVTKVPNYIFDDCDSLKSIEIPSTVTEIGDCAFQYADGLESIEIPDSVLTIDTDAFYSAKNLKKVKLSNNLTGIGISAFNACVSLEEIAIPETVTEIHRYAFCDCAKLAKANLPHKLTYLGAHVFHNCVSLTEINIPRTLDGVDGWNGHQAFTNTALTKVVFDEGVTKVPNYFFDDCDSLKSIEIPSTVTEIGDCAFQYADGIESIEIPDSVTTIDTDAFYCAKNLKKVKLSNRLTAIGISAFNRCVNLEEIAIPETVTSIERYAFCDCTLLAKVNLPHNLTYLGAHAFHNCVSLTEINIPKTITYVDGWNGHQAFTNTALTKVVFDEGIEKIPNHFFDDCDSLKDVVIPSTVTEIGTGAFQYADGLESIVIPDSVTTIDTDAFLGAKGLKTIKLSSNLTAIGISAFNSCVNLEGIEIPETVTSIERYAFCDCTKLAKANLPHKLTYLGAHVFQNCVNLTEINIPKTLDGVDGWNGHQAFTNTALTKVVFDEGVEKVPNFFFDDCDSLKQIEIPVTVKRVGTGAFQYTDSLESVELPDSVLTIDTEAFLGAKGLKTIKLHDNLTGIGISAFNGCTNLESITVPDTVTEIHRYAFCDCSNLKTVKLSDSLTYIGGHAFQNAASLEEITFPASVKTIDYWNGCACFAGNTSLKKAVFEGSLNDIPGDMFSGDTSLSTIVFPKDLKKICGGAFYNCDSLATLTIPDTVTTIEGSAFKDCDGLTDVVIADSVKDIGSYCFESCEKLKNFKLGTGMTYIPEGMFYKCPVFESLILPYGIKSIAKNAFVDCTKFKSITIPKTVDSIADTAFSYFASLTVYGLAGSYAETWAKNKGANFKPINKPAQKVEFSKPELTLANGASERLTFKVTPEDFTDDFEWRVSGDKNAVTVSDDGTVKAVGIGEATVKILFGDEGEVYAACKVTVVQPVTDINIEQWSCELETGETVQLNATVNPENAYDKTFTWSSSDDSIATVDENGLVTAIAKGEATITAKANDGSGEYDTCRINVTREIINCKSWTELESAHKYANNSDLLWRYQQPGANKLTLTFDEKTSLDDGGDYIYIFNGKKERIGEYTGTELAGRKIDVPGDTVRIQLVSGKSITDWGFKVTNLTADEETYTLSFDSNGHGEAPASMTEVSSIPSGLKELAATGYTFGGWYMSKDCKDNEKAVAGTRLSDDTTLFAKWTANTYTVTLNPGEGKLPAGAAATIKVTYEQPYGELTEAVAEDGAFAGWFTSADGGNEITATTVVTTPGDHTLYAQYRSVESLLTPYVTDASGNRYDSGMTLEKGTLLYLTSDNHGAAIYYTTKDSEKNNIPEDAAHLYKGAFPYDKGMTVYAKAARENYKSSRIVSFTYELKDTAADWGDVVAEDRTEYADADKIPAEIWATGYTDMDYTGSAITFDDTLRVYYGKKLLTLGTDYTVKYSNNVKASTSTKKATIAIFGKGNYTGQRKLTFDILPLSLGDGVNNSQHVKVADVQALYTGNTIRSVTTITYYLDEKEIVLKKNTDFVYDYSQVGADPGTYTVKINGKGNYAGTATFTETIYSKEEKINISKLTFKKIPAQTADGFELTPELTITDKITDKSNPYELTADDYEAKYFNNVLPGTATVVVTGKEGSKYAGTKTISFKINGISITKAKFEIGKATYTGTALIPEYKGTYQPNKNEAVEDIFEDEDYTVSVSNNINKGRGTITFTGKGRFTGTAKKNFTIAPQDLTKGLVTVSCGDVSSSEVTDALGSFKYAKAGVKPELTLTFGDQELVSGRDYKVTYANNKAVGKTGKIAPFLTITGTGNFTGKMIRTFVITPGDLADTTIKATDFVASDKKANFKTTVTVYDSNGTKLAAGADYKRDIDYTYVAAGKVLRKNGKAYEYYSVEAGETVNKRDIIPAGTDIMVTIHGMLNYDGASSQSVVISCVDNLLSNAKVTLKNTKPIYYTGNRIELSESDLRVTVSGKLVLEGAYRITSITENDKKGTAKITISGTGKYGDKYYGGSTTATFKIKAKTLTIK